MAKDKKDNACPKTPIAKDVWDVMDNDDMRGRFKRVLKHFECDSDIDEDILRFYRESINANRAIDEIVDWKQTPVYRINLMTPLKKPLEKSNVLKEALGAKAVKLATARIAMTIGMLNNLKKNEDTDTPKQKVGTPVQVEKRGSNGEPIAETTAPEAPTSDEQMSTEDEDPSGDEENALEEDLEATENTDISVVADDDNVDIEALSCVKSSVDQQPLPTTTQLMAPDMMQFFLQQLAVKDQQIAWLQKEVDRLWALSKLNLK